MKSFRSRKTESQKGKDETKSCLRADMKVGYSYKVLGFCRKFKVAQVGPPPDVKEAFAMFADGLDYMSADQLRRFLVEHQGQLDCSVPLAEQIISQVLQKQRSLSPTERGSNPRLGLEDFFYFLFLDDLNGPLKSQRKCWGIETILGFPSNEEFILQFKTRLLCFDIFENFNLEYQIPKSLFEIRAIKDWFLSRDHFIYYLETAVAVVHHDMTAPLSHYFIYTGHNSYLTGNQLSSDCSEVPIIKALRRGVKVIELDLWPNSAKDDILVLHGRTLTSPVTLIKCLKSIKEHAFEKSPYPVIITLEDHLSADLQAKVAELVTATFGEMLYCHHAECLAEFPSPEALKYRVVISTKPPKEYLHTKQTKDKVKNSQSEKGSSEEKVSGQETSDHAAGPEADQTSESDPDDEEDINASDFKSFQQGAPEYKRLITIHAGKPKGSLKEALAIEADKVRRLSLSEQGLEKAVTSHGTDVVRFTQKNILRVYPKGTRVTSSNFRPHVGWMYGAQMVAFNMQGYGKSLWMMHGMFRSNGGCGYVKKPEFLIHKGLPAFDPRNILPPKTTLKVKVYMGNGWSSDFSLTHFDTYSPPDFYTKVYIIGVPADASKKKTRIIEDSWEPVWDEEFKFPLTVPELALLRVEVRDYDRSEKDDFGGQTCLPVSELRPGIRAVPLYDKKGEKFNSVKLLMRFQFV